MALIFRRLVFFTACFAFVVIVVGAYVRLEDAGLGCPDWPGCYGQLVGVPVEAHEIARAEEAFSKPVDVGRARKEMFHRYIAGTLGVLILTIALIAWSGRAALRKATDYAKERRVFGRAIGQNQGIQHPLARCWAHLEAANLMVMKAAALYDEGKECGAESNAAKYLAAEAGFSAAETAVMTHGGMGYAQEYHVERYLRESLIPRIAPVSRELILSHIAERVLGLPKSY